MKRHLLLGMTVGTAALIGVASLINQDPSTTPTAAPLMAAAVGVFVGSLWVVFRAAASLSNQDAPSGWLIWRQALLWSVTAGVLLYLQGLRSLSLFEAALIALAAILLELFFRSEKTDVRRVNTHL